MSGDSEEEERRRIEDALHRQEEQFFVEEVGLAFERLGHPRMAGRVMGLLLLADPPYLCVTEISDLLQASKGSISSMTQLLLHLGLIEPVGLPGSRRAYLRITPNAWGQLLRQSTEQAAKLRQIAEQGLRLTRGRPEGPLPSLEEMRDLYAYIEREFPQLLARWHEERHRPA